MDVKAITHRFRDLKVLVIGEMMLDVYFYGTSNRICREAPVPVVNIQTVENVPGAAANTALNLARLGAQATFLTVTGKDADAKTVISILDRQGVNTSAIFQDPARQTLTKKRILAGDQLLVRYDAGSVEAVSQSFEKYLLKRLAALYAQMDVILVSDYGYGVITDPLTDLLYRFMQKDRKLVVVDSKDLRRFHRLAPVAVKPNYEEAISLLGLNKEERGQRVDQIRATGQRILDVTGATIAAVTIDSEGAVIFEREKNPYRTYAKPVSDSKAAGAGDTYVSTFSLGLSLGLSPLAAAELAAAAAGVVVRKSGTATCSAEELVAYFDPPRKIISDWDELECHLQSYREQGRKIVFTNGCFDILHRGHITYLEQAKALGHVLVVGVNSDDSVRRLKGPERPINSLEDRLHILAALDTVDHVVAFSDDTPAELIKMVKPDLFAKGGDYSRVDLPEVPVVEAIGGSVVILPYISERSTTAVIEKIRSLDRAG